MNEPFWQTKPDAPFATLINVARTYCHPELDEDAYESLRRLAQRDDDEEMTTFKQELRDGLVRPEKVPQAELSRAVQYDDGSADKFLRRLWHDLYPDEPVPGQA